MKYSKSLGPASIAVNYSRAKLGVFLG